MAFLRQTISMEARLHFVLALSDALKLDEIMTDGVFERYLSILARRDGKPTVPDYFRVELLEQVCVFYFTERDKTWNLVAEVLRIASEKNADNPFREAPKRDKRVIELAKECSRRLVGVNFYANLQKHLDLLYSKAAISPSKAHDDVYHGLTAENSIREIRAFFFEAANF